LFFSHKPETKHMAREFDPNDPNRMDAPAGAPMNDPLIREPRSSLGTIGMLAGLAIAIVLGMLFWSMGDGTNSTSSNTGPGTTTGSSTTPPPAPPADAGKTDQR
jgi:hypothetical protein